LLVADVTERLSSDDFARWWKETGERELRQLLYWKWDPIGVSDSFPQAIDEYDGYAPQVVQALRRGAAQNEISVMLETIERNRMGLGRAPSGPAKVAARRILDWYAESQDRWLEFGPLRQ
jgi:hypothetical protein